MTQEEIEELLDELAKFLKETDGQDLPASQRAPLFGFLLNSGQEYSDMAVTLRNHGYFYVEGSLKNGAYKICRRLSQAFNTKVDKSNCNRVLLSWYRTQRREGKVLPPIVPLPIVKSSHLLGRESDMAALREQISRGCRVICLNGPPLIGKTSLAQTLFTDLQPSYEFSRWLSAIQVPTLSHLCQEVAIAVGETARNDDTEAGRLLLNLFHRHQLLIVIDRTESFMEPNSLSGKFQRTALQYEAWLNLLLEDPSNQSCLIWVGRESPSCLRRPLNLLHIHHLGGIPTVACANLLKNQQIPAEPGPVTQQLVSFCGRNPGLLLIVAQKIHALHQNDPKQFLANPFLSGDGMDSFVHTLNILTKKEKLVLVWLMLTPLTHNQMRELHPLGDPPYELLKALESLIERRLVTQDEKGVYQVHPPLLKHILAKEIVTRLGQEVRTNQIDELCQYPLLLAGITTHRQEWQRQYLLKPLAGKLQSWKIQREQFNRILADLQQEPLLEQSYAAGNLLNLAVCLSIPLADLEFSGLPISYADLRHANARDGNATGCSFRETLLPIRLADPLTAAMSPDGSIVTVGDNAGRILCWRRNQETLHLHAFYQLSSSPIDILVCPENDTLIFASNRDVYRWWINDDVSPVQIMQTPERVTYLTQDSLGQIVAGLSNGQIVFNNIANSKEVIRDGHRNRVCVLAFSADDWYLASLGNGNRILIWTIADDEDDLYQYNEIPTGTRPCLAIGWDQQKLIRAEVEAEDTWSQIRLWFGEKYYSNRLVLENLPETLNFSDNSQYLVGSCVDGSVFVWHWQTGQITLIEDIEARSNHLFVSNDGHYLLAIDRTAPSQVQLWNAHQNCKIWEIDTAQGECSGLDLRGARGILPTELKLLLSLDALIDPI